MATEIIDYTIGSDLKAGPDQIFTAQALADTGTVTSNAFILGNPMGRNEVKVTVATAGSLTAALTINIQTSATSDGSFTTVESFTIPLGAITAGQVLASYIPVRESEDELYSKITLVTTDDESAMAVDAYLVYVS